MRATGILVCLGLSGCLFGNDDPFSYTAELSDNTRTVYAYNADGSIKQRLGVGVEATASGVSFGAGVDGSIRDDLQDGENSLLFLWPAGLWDEIADRSSSRSPSFVGLTLDSTFILRMEAGILLPTYRVRDARAGFPCTFSDARAFQVATNGDTIPLPVSGTHLDRADSVRFAVMLDETSLTPDAGFDSREPVTATIRVTCPSL